MPQFYQVMTHSSPLVPQPLVSLCHKVSHQSTHKCSHPPHISNLGHLANCIRGFFLVALIIISYPLCTIIISNTIQEIWAWSASFGRTSANRIIILKFVLIENCQWINAPTQFCYWINNSCSTSNIGFCWNPRCFEGNELDWVW